MNIMEKEKRRPWLAISMGCCASGRDSVDEDEGRDALRVIEEPQMKICLDQPTTIEHPRAEPMSPPPRTSQSTGRHVSQWVATSRDFVSRASSRASVHTLTRPRKSHSRARLSIGRPTDFRHDHGYDGAESIQSMLDEASMPVRRRRSFRPLELSIYLPDGRLSPLPDFELDEWGEMPQMPAQVLVRNRDSRTNSMSSDPSTASYLVQRKPVGSGSRRSSVQSTQSGQSRPLSGTLSTLPFLQEEPKSRPESLSSSTPSDLQRRGTLSPPRVLSRRPSPSRPRASTAPSRPASLRRVKSDVDEAIRELNTIVEERRADAYRSRTQCPSFTNRPPPSPSSHVPAIAPSLRMHVRSETLSDIGSAFSVPLATKPLPPPPPPPSRLSRQTRLSLAPTLTRTFSGPLDSNPITPRTPPVLTPTSIHRLGAWLKRSLPTTPSSPSSSFKSTTPKSTSPLHRSFYKCVPEPASAPAPRASTATSSSTSSSPTITPSQTHSRHPSASTATVTLLSTAASSYSASYSYPSTPSLSSTSTTTHTHSPHSSLDSTHSHCNYSAHLPPAPTTLPNPHTASRTPPLRGPGKTRRIPAPLELHKSKEVQIEDVALGSARSFTSVASTTTRGSTGSARSSLQQRRSLKPPPSPNYGILRGLEISARKGGVTQHLSLGMLPSPGGVGVAF